MLSVSCKPFFVLEIFTIELEQWLCECIAQYNVQSHRRATLSLGKSLQFVKLQDCGVAENQFSKACNCE